MIQLIVDGCDGAQQILDSVVRQWREREEDDDAVLLYRVSKILPANAPSEPAALAGYVERGIIAIVVGPFVMQDRCLDLEVLPLGAVETLRFLRMKANQVDRRRVYARMHCQTEPTPYYPSPTTWTMRRHSRPAGDHPCKSGTTCQNCKDDAARLVR